MFFEIFNYCITIFYLTSCFCVFKIIHMTYFCIFNITDINECTAETYSNYRIEKINMFSCMCKACLCGHLCARSPGAFGGLALPWSVSCRCIIDVMLRCVSCTRLIRIRIIVCSVIFHLLRQASTYASCGCSTSIRVWSIKV